MRKRARLFCPHCGREIAQQNARYGTLKVHREPLDIGGKGPAPICPGSNLRGVNAHPLQPGGSYA